MIGVDGLMDHAGLKVLILGGTGAMGEPLVDILAADRADVYVTTRSRRTHSQDNVHYLWGNAMDSDFLISLLSEKWDCIVDFMFYHTEQFKSRIDLFLNSTDQYVFISSARVYADCNGLITEDSPRLLDTCTDRAFLNTDEYSLSKARQENELFGRGMNGVSNWTIIRPSLTYSKKKLQLGAYEKETWLKRVLEGKSLVFSMDLMDRWYTMTTGKDVAAGIAGIVGNQRAFGEVFHITTEKAMQWKDILSIYMDVLKERGERVNLVLSKKCSNLMDPDSKYQVLYGRYFNRRFDNSKIAQYVDIQQFEDPREGLRHCLNQFLDKPEFDCPNWKIVGMVDRTAKEYTHLGQIAGKRNKIIYFIYRLHLQRAYFAVRRIKRSILRKK